MEKFSYELTTSLGRRTRSRIIKNTRGKIFIPFYLPYACIAILIHGRKYDLVHLGDPVLAVVGYVSKLFFPTKRVVCTVHGLDLTYQDRNPLYRIYLKIFLRCDLFVAISKNTQIAAKKYGLANTIFIPPGMITENYKRRSNRNRGDFMKSFGVNANTESILLTVGRLVSRKGVAWFVANVMPLLPESHTYLIVGDGINREKIQQQIKVHGLEERVKMLGKVSSDELALLYGHADLFVMPNVPVQNDLEGFGLVALEASCSGLPVVASDLEGISDAISNGNNGLLVEPKNVESWVRVIEDVMRDRVALKIFADHGREYSKRHFDWGAISQKYFAALSRIVINSTDR